MGKKSETYTRSSSEIRHNIIELSDSKQKLESAVELFQNVESRLKNIQVSVDEAWQSEAATTFKNGLTKQIKSVNKLYTQYESTIALLKKKIQQEEAEFTRAQKHEEQVRVLVDQIKKSLEFLNRL